jgi:phosphatidylserine/phosphatidylglycerophosphate/cardiolipin synthase-like enzyme
LTPRERGKSFIIAAGLISVFGVVGIVHQSSVAGGAVAPADATLEAAFAPDAGAEELVVKVIGSATNNVKMSAYTFTSPAIVRALIAAKKRGVQIQLIADDRANLSEDQSGKARHALNAVSEAGIEVRLIGAYALHHDKLLIVDDRHIQTGSFNYTNSAARRNSENVLVVWNNPALAAIYLRHWSSRWSQGRDYQRRDDQASHAGP